MVEFWHFFHLLAKNSVTFILLFIDLIIFLFKVVGLSPLHETSGTGGFHVLLLNMLNVLHAFSTHFANFSNHQLILPLFLWQLILDSFHRFFKLLNLFFVTFLYIVNLKLRLFPHVLDNLLILWLNPLVGWLQLQKPVSEFVHWLGHGFLVTELERNDIFELLQWGSACKLQEMLKFEFELLDVLKTSQQVPQAFFYLVSLGHIIVRTRPCLISVFLQSIVIVRIIFLVTHLVSSESWISEFSQKHMERSVIGSEGKTFNARF